jgi:hypothetical protein
VDAVACRLASNRALAESCSSKAIWCVTAGRSDGDTVQNCTQGGAGGGGLARWHATKAIPAVNPKCCQARRGDGRILWGTFGSEERIQPSNAPHKLQGRGASHLSMGEARRWCQPPRNPMAAPCQLHAVVRRRKAYSKAVERSRTSSELDTIRRVSSPPVD